MGIWGVGRAGIRAGGCLPLVVVFRLPWAGMKVSIRGLGRKARSPADVVSVGGNCDR